MNRRGASLAALFGATAVLLGAFGAHALRGTLDSAALQIWQTAVAYQFWHALALLAASFAPTSRWRSFGSWLFAVGIAAFCGSLYALAAGAPRAVGVITPIGGVALVAGWLCLTAALWRTAK